jgi:predicted acetyltransferase
MEVRIVDPSEMGGFVAVMEHAFGFDLKEESREHFINEFELDRLVAAFDGDQLVGTGGAFTFDLTVPGGTVGCGGTTVIAVLPTHRRRGVLTDMMRFHLDEVEGRGEPVAALWASEAPIYGRFGYGVATQFFRTKLSRNRLSFPRPSLGTGTVRILNLDEAKAVLPALYEKIRPLRPGFLSRADRRWNGVHFYDPPEWREGGTSKRWALYEEAGEPLGYVLYRQHEKWDEGLAANRVSVGPMHAASPAAEEALWRYLLSIDLVATIESWNTDPSSILAASVADARRVERTISDGMWVRILDVPAALSARRYQIAGRLVIEVSDPFRGSASGTFALEGGPSGATCEPSTDAPGIRLDVRELGSAYLGGFSFSELGRAGLVKGTPDALRTADLMFGWDIRPWCPEVF